MEAFLTELTALLPNTMFHLGGDEVQYQCWESSPKMVEYLASRNMTGVQLYQEFECACVVGLGRYYTPAVSAYTCPPPAAH